MAGGSPVTNEPDQCSLRVYRRPRSSTLSKLQAQLSAALQRHMSMCTCMDRDDVCLVARHADRCVRDAVRWAAHRRRSESRLRTGPSSPPSQGANESHCERRWSDAQFRRLCKAPASRGWRNPQDQP